MPYVASNIIFALLVPISFVAMQVYIPDTDPVTFLIVRVPPCSSITLAVASFYNTSYVIYTKRTTAIRVMLMTNTQFIVYQYQRATCS